MIPSLVIFDIVVGFFFAQHNVDEALKFGIVSYDWSNAKQLWVNNFPKPMNDEELLTKQAEMVLAADKKPNKTKVWIYRNT